MKLDRISAERIARILRVAPLLGEGHPSTSIARWLDLSPNMVRSDRDVLYEHGRKALEDRALYLKLQDAPDRPEAKSGCVYMQVRDGRAERCGKRCKGQYCPAHSKAIAPMPGSPCGAGRSLSEFNVRGRK